ncbi:MAG: VOC family protein [Acidobacteriota bacterium]
MGRPVVHFEIGCKDKAKMDSFYSKLFEWSIEDIGPASMISTGTDVGIEGHITALGHEPHHYVTFYVEVENLQAYLEKAHQLGGQTLVPPTEVPDSGYFAWLADPEGNTVGLWEPIESSD